MSESDDEPKRLRLRFSMEADFETFRPDEKSSEGKAQVAENLSGKMLTKSDLSKVEEAAKLLKDELGLSYVELDEISSDIATLWEDQGGLKVAIPRYVIKKWRTSEILAMRTAKFDSITPD